MSQDQGPPPEPDKAVALSQGPARLSAQGIRGGYGRGDVVKGVDFRAREGAVTILVGPNGCGKSTLLKLLSRLLQPREGSVLLDGTPLRDIPTRRVAQRLALLPQGPVAPEGLTVRELVAQGRFPHHSLVRQWSRDDARAVEAAMASAGVTEFAAQRVDELSGGQRQRCWIAMVLAQETEILLLDEPTTFLDLKVQFDLMQLLRDIAHRSGRTLVVVMHELNVAATFADHLVMMRDGVVVADGPVREVFTSGNLARVFDLDANILTDPETGRPICVPRLATDRALAAE
ncbi:ABC transporter ATP-binding protein [Roseivivax sp. GX 12232]|uniref:ABC transporter ATP-binding protein n=1 Tax=Roseivivax sp. GX 12232 TaxID=2900547 RepID=UPI001E58E99E|nr:ABC transporter ATP-binding protein [Roseivivax sp. GX 12232]MCE0505907.1 ABC transporter ATP-binding protein [Roseivivax sp. GX 12232]